MFTGLIQRLGTIRRVSRGRGLVIEIAFSPWPTPLELGESVAVNGVCLTVAAAAAGRFTAEVLKETESASTLGGLLPGAKVNLERAVRAGEPLGGHIVQGHVDGRGTLIAKQPRGRDFRLQFKCGRRFAALSVNKGSVAVDGVSLTISDLTDETFSVDVIPTTCRETTLGALRVGESVNLESDVLCRAAQRPQGFEPSGSGGLTRESLVRAGFLDDFDS